MKKLSLTLFVCLFLCATGTKHSYGSFFMNDKANNSDKSDTSDAKADTPKVTKDTLSRSERRRKHKTGFAKSPIKTGAKPFTLFPKEDSGAEEESVIKAEEPKDENQRPIFKPESDKTFSQAEPAEGKTVKNQRLPKPKVPKGVVINEDGLNPNGNAPAHAHAPAPTEDEQTIASKNWDYNPGDYDYKPRYKTPEEVLAFDISGLKLGMKLDIALFKAKEKGFVPTHIENEIPQFMVWKYDSECKRQGFTLLSDVNACKQSKAKKDDLIYTSAIDLENPVTREKLHLFFTSKYTDNKIYKIKYKTFQDKSAGISKKSIYKQQDKNRNFWIRVLKKYGSPDNHDDQTWGKGTGYPYLKAETGFLTLEDPRISYMDSKKMMLVDKNMENSNMYSF